MTGVQTCALPILYTSPAVPPWFTVWTVLFAKYLYIPGNWRMPHVTGYLVCSVIFNLSLCPQRPIWQTAFPPGSHLPGFSVRAWLLWLPLHRFNLLNLHLIYHRKLYLSTRNFIFNNIFLSLSGNSLQISAVCFRRISAPDNPFAIIWIKAQNQIFPVSRF